MEPKRNQPCPCGSAKHSIAVLWNLYMNGGKTLDDIGRSIGVSRRTVGRLFNHYGFCTKSRAEAVGFGEHNRTWRGGKTIDKDGYVLRRVGGKYIREHRLVMEQHLGRKLLSDEVIHHVNGKKNDNRIENLELYTSTAHNRKGTLFGRWSRKYLYCIQCNTTKREHAGKGLCTRCAVAVREKKRCAS